MKIGDKVVCIDCGPCKCGCGFQPPILLNQVYVVRDMDIFYGELGLKLVGLENMKARCDSEKTIGYLNANRFRLLDEIKSQHFHPTARLKPVASHGRETL